MQHWCCNEVTKMNTVKHLADIWLKTTLKITFFLSVIVFPWTFFWLYLCLCAAVSAIGRLRTDWKIACWEGNSEIVMVVFWHSECESRKQRVALLSLVCLEWVRQLLPRRRSYRTFRAWKGEHFGPQVEDRIHWKSLANAVIFCEIWLLHCLPENETLLSFNCLRCRWPFLSLGEH